MKGQLKIEEMFAFIVLDDDGTEGIPAFERAGMLIPLVGAEMTRVGQLEELVRADKMLKGKKVTLAKFSVREDIKVIDRRD